MLRLNKFLVVQVDESLCGPAGKPGDSVLDARADGLRAEVRAHGAAGVLADALGRAHARQGEAGGLT